jgi:hypothetical protein
MNTRNRTSSEYIGYGLYFYFSGFSLRKISERLSSCFIKREKSCINQSGIGYKQKYKPKKIFESKTIAKSLNEEPIWSLALLNMYTSLNHSLSQKI